MLDSARLTTRHRSAITPPSHHCYNVPAYEQVGVVPTRDNASIHTEFCINF